MTETIMAIPHVDLTGELQDSVRALFDAEYLQSFGAWSPELPYGYAGHDLHLIAEQDGAVVGHVGWAHRLIAVGEQNLNIAGVGGVLVSPSARGSGLGQHLMKAALDTMRIMNDQGIVRLDFAYLGCREEVAGFYESCGFSRIRAREFYVDRKGNPAVSEPGEPLYVFPLSTQSFPQGDINLAGRHW